MKTVKKIYPTSRLAITAITLKSFVNRRYITSVLMLLGSLFASAQTTPVEGVTTFNTITIGDYEEYAFTSNASAGFSATNVQNSGWDITGYSTGADDYLIAGENWGSGSDGGFVYLALNSGTTTISSMRFKANDGKLFDLKTIDLGYDVNGANTNFTITGYRFGNAVPGASFSVPSFASFGNGGDWKRAIDLTANGNFLGIDEFRITPNTPGLLGALDVDNINATNFRDISFTQIVPADIPASHAGPFTKQIAGHNFTFTPSADSWVDYNFDIGSEGFGGLYAFDYNTLDGTETTISAPAGYTFDLGSFQYISNRSSINLTVTITFANNSTDTKVYTLNGNSFVHTFAGFTTAVDDVKAVKLVTDALVYVNNFELVDIKSLGTLPLQWLQFTARKQGTGILLNWKTTAEQSTRDFQVQHSIDGRHWENIGTVAATGIAGGEQAYSFLHSNPADGINAYRLFQRDVDDRGTFSAIVSVNLKTINEGFSVYPNPATAGGTQVKLKSPAVVCVYNSVGELVLRKQFPAGISALDLSNFSKGVYTLTADGRSLQLIVQ